MTDYPYKLLAIMATFGGGACLAALAEEFSLAGILGLGFVGCICLMFRLTDYRQTVATEPEYKPMCWECGRHLADAEDGRCSTCREAEQWLS